MPMPQPLFFHECCRHGTSVRNTWTIMGLSQRGDRGSTMRKTLVTSIRLGNAFIATIPALAADISQPPSLQGRIRAGVQLGEASTSAPMSAVPGARDTVTQGPAADAETGTISSAGVAGGGQLGFNWLPMPNLLLGAEVDVMGADLNGTTTTTGVLGVAHVGWNEKVDVFGTARGRLGYVWNNWLFYAEQALSPGRTKILRAPSRWQLRPRRPPASAYRTRRYAPGGRPAAAIEWGFAPRAGPRKSNICMSI